MIREEDFKKTANLRKRILLYRLENYAQKEKSVCKVIDYFSDPNYKETHEEVPSDLSYLYEELAKVKQKIKKTLEKAVELGMDDVDVINLNLAEYVLNQ